MMNIYIFAYDVCSKYMLYIIIRAVTKLNLDM